MHAPLTGVSHAARVAATRSHAARSAGTSARMRLAGAVAFAVDLLVDVFDLHLYERVDARSVHPLIVASAALVFGHAKKRVLGADATCRRSACPESFAASRHAARRSSSAIFGAHRILVTRENDAIQFGVRSVNTEVG